MSYPSISDLQEVNTEVNKFPYVADADRYDSEEFWKEIDETGGDCEDFAIGKLHRLVKLGWPIEALRLACCYVETKEYHAILVVNLIVSAPDGKEYILDNRFPELLSLDDLERVGYTPDKIQKEGGSRIWCKWNWVKE